MAKKFYKLNNKEIENLYRKDEDGFTKITEADDIYALRDTYCTRVKKKTKKFAINSALFLGTLAAFSWLNSIIIDEPEKEDESKK